MYSPSPIKIIMADIDGTLITKGDLVNGFPARLSEIIIAARKRGVGFSLASGRDQYAEQELWTRITGDIGG
ncbi:MAG: HAD hydrolase family protein, partial [Nanoarchaeota archaeon]|nr:HAD hydrolase family protein [Nanoarchaeota archaeon]